MSTRRKVYSFTLEDDVIKSIDVRSRSLGMNRSDFLNWYFHYANQVDNVPITKLLTNFIKEAGRMAKESKAKPELSKEELEK